jgi:hypothetical protein
VLAAARQSLLMPASQPANSGTRNALETTLQTEVSKLCVQAAVSAITTLHTNLQSPSRVFSSIAVLMTLSAATVIIAGSLVSELGVNLEAGIGPYKDALAKAFQVLDGHMWQIEGAQSAKELIEKFLETVNRQNRRRNNSGKLTPIALSLHCNYCLFLTTPSGDKQPGTCPQREWTKS